MLKLNATLHEAIMVGQQQGQQIQGEQDQQGKSASGQGKNPVTVSALFKHVSHVLYLWMD